jgi:uridylate kinase
MKVVIDVGGSIFASPVDIDYIKRFSEFLIKLHREGYKLMVVVGGGEAAKDYISMAEELGGGEELLDEIGIAITRVNAMLLGAALGKHAARGIPTETKKINREGILVMGGTKPGQTTDAVAAELAWLNEAELLLIASNVDGVYSDDPRANPQAKLYTRMTTRELLELASKRKHTPGYSGIIDPIAARMIHERKIKTIVVNGFDLENMEKAIKGGNYRGTLVEA